MRPLLPLLLLLLALAIPLTGCKKKGEGDTDVALGTDVESSDDDGDKPGKKQRGKKRKGKKKKKRKQEELNKELLEEESSEAGRAAVKSALKRARKDEKERTKLATAGVQDLARAESAGVVPAVETAKTADPRRGLPEVTPPPVKVAVARLLTVIDVNRLLQEKGWIAYGPVQGIPPSEYFNSLIYRKPGTNRFVTILVWEFPQYAQALEKWNEMAATYPNTQELKEMFTKFVFFSNRNQVSTLTALREEKSTVLSISCHSEICDDTALYEMAKTAFGRVR